MNALILSVLILAAPGEEATSGHFAEAVEVYRCDFESDSDINFDNWPDGWTRLRGELYPQYLKIGIDQKPQSQSGQQHLRIQLDGGAAALYSPHIQISPSYSYVVEAYLRTEQLKQDVAYFSVTFYDAQKQPLETFESRHFRDVPQWEKVVLGPVLPSSAQARTAVVSLHLRPTAGADLTGAALFDEIWFGRLPRMTLHTNSPHNVYTDANNIAVSCRFSGMSRPNPPLYFELRDLQDNVLLRESLQSSGTFSGDASSKEKSFTGEAVWRPRIHDYGFYRVRVSMEGLASIGNDRTGMTLLRESTLVLVPEHEGVAGGEFGWALPQGDHPLSLTVLSSLLEHVGINWVKFPVWYGEKDKDWADKLARFAEHLSAAGIEMVGVLDQPPPAVRHQFGEHDRLVVASVFVEPELWHPVVDPVITRLSLKVRWWQLGADDDVSYVGFLGLENKVREIADYFSRFGQQVHLGLSWRWLHQPPESSQPPWGFISYTVDPPFTVDELTAYLNGPRQETSRRWVVMEPLRRDEYPVETRARDLVARMMAAKIAKAEGIFVPNPFSDEHGLMNRDGTPGELLLPWRTTALMISGSEFIGSIKMPEGSQNYVFARGDEAVMVVWATQPVKEKIYLGDNIQQVDLWNRIRQPQTLEESGFVRQEIEVGTLPTFITGVNLPIAKVRMSFNFDRNEIPSVFGRQQTARYRFKNHFGQGVGGTVKLHVPAVWQAEPDQVRFKLAEGEELTEDLHVLLRADASSGPQPVQIDFDITADKNYRFSVYRVIEVGLGDVTVELSTRLDPQGNLIVEQNLINKTDQFVSFNCMLFAPNRRRQREQVLNLARGGNTSMFVLPNGEELLGRTLWLRAEEIGGDRILNYHVVAEK